MPVARVPEQASVSGHRARLRDRLLKAGPDALNDQDLLEITLFVALPRRDTKHIAKRLLERFKSFAGAIAAPPAELAGVDGLGTAGIAALKTVQAAAQRLVRAEVTDKELLSDWERLMRYLNAELAREKTEQFRILFLDTRNRLKADEVQSRGTVNHTAVYPREVAKRALELSASAVILVHNHPSGDPAPSAEDVAMTKEVAAALSTISVVLHDHIIVGNGCWTSLRREGLL
ncbi:MAG: RadC family protein [Acetobacteraceae bacterium]